MQVAQAFPYLIIYKEAIGLLVAGVGALIMWPYRVAKKEWTSLKETTAKIHEELTQQRTNCLATLSQQGEKQIDLLTKVADTLDGLRLDTQAQTGFIQGLVASPRRSRAKK